MSKEKKIIKNVVLSASKLKVFKSCSWLYNCQYEGDKIPQEGNYGSSRGTVVHLLFECLLKPRHRKHYDLIVKEKSIKNIPVIFRFINKQMKKEKIIDECDNKGNNNFKLIDEMILVGLLYDFYCEEGKLEQAETEFNYTDPKSRYTVRGFIDKLASKEDLLMIYDYKSSSDVFKGADLEFNVQALMYSLYAKRVRKMDSLVRFIFLRFPDNPVQELAFSDEDLNNFEQYLIKVTKILNNFTIKDAKSNLAARQPYAKDKSFSGPVSCGYAKYKGHIKPATGEPYWHCAYKFDFHYWTLCNAEDETIKTSKEDNLIADESKGEYVLKKKYAGCPAFLKKNN